jgi:hypothetical protein
MSQKSKEIKNINTKYVPDPQTAIPVAKALLFSKYIETLTIAGR